MKKSYILFLFLLCTTFSFSQPNQLIIGANNNGAIMSALLDGSNPTEITGLGYQSFYNGAYNSTDGKVYMSWYYGIYSMDVDGSNFTTLYDFPLGGMGDGIDIDEANGHIYFTCTPLDSIFRMDLNGSNLTGVYGGTGTVDYLSDVQVDMVNGHIYFGEWIMASKGLYRVDLNGTNEINLLSGFDVKNLKLDLVNNHIYYNDNQSIRRCDLLGGSDTTIITGFQAGGIEFNLSMNKLYTTDMTNSKVISCSMTGANVTELVQPSDITFAGDPLESPHGPILVFNPALCLPTTSIITLMGFTISSNATAGATFQWLDCDNGYSIIPGETSQDYTATVNGSYTVEVTENGCVDTLACVTINNVGIEDVDFTNVISMHPNPTTGKILLDFTNTFNQVSIKVIGIDGYLVSENEYSSVNHVEFDIDSASGVYFVEIVIDNTERAILKLIKN